tara:strand:- start:301 stop:555 length:255 start_codon:yes stop_codon:yes gene_type:complete
MKNNSVEKMGLTHRQRQVFNFLIMFDKVHEVFPTLREVANGELDGKQCLRKVSSVGGIHRILRELETRGWIGIRSSSERAIRIL